MLKQALAQNGLIAILRGLRPQEAAAIGEVLYAAGFRVIEVPLNSPEPYDSIRILRSTLPADCLIGAGTVLTPEQDQPLLKALGRGIYWQQLIDSGAVASGTEIAEREGIHRSTVNVFLRLALLSPDIVQAAYEGRLPRAVSLESIWRATVPLDWNEQRRLIASLG